LRAGLASIRSKKGFNIKRAPLDPHLFIQERDAAFAPSTPTSEIPLDRSATIGLTSPATLPLLLAGYLRLNKGERLKTKRLATGEIYVALRGQGRSRKGRDEIAWAEGDIFCLPGSEPAAEHEVEACFVLYYVCDEPVLRFLGRARPSPARRRLRPCFILRR
jgi:hypothetical protein